jgi:hypothetical protein
LPAQAVRKPRCRGARKLQYRIRLIDAEYLLARDNLVRLRSLASDTHSCRALYQSKTRNPRSEFQRLGWPAPSSISKWTFPACGFSSGHRPSLSRCCSTRSLIADRVRWSYNSGSERSLPRRNSIKGTEWLSATRDRPRGRLDAASRLHGPHSRRPGNDPQADRARWTEGDSHGISG